MAVRPSGKYKARIMKERGHVELKLAIDAKRRDAIMKCIEGGDLRLVLQDVDLERLADAEVGGGYLWD